MICGPKAYIPLQRKILASGLALANTPPTPEFCDGDINMLVSKNAKICVTPNAKPKICVSPNAKPKRKSVEYRWRWVFWRWPCIFHVYFMYISCCLCIIFRVGYAKLADAKADSSGIQALACTLIGVNRKLHVLSYIFDFPINYSVDIQKHSQGHIRRGWNRFEVM